MFFHPLSMLSHLSQDIVIVVLQDWLNVSLSCLSALDIAFCNDSLQPDWHQLISCLRIPSASTKQPLAAFLTWIHSRNVHIKRLIVDMALANELVDQCQLPIRLTTVPGLQFNAAAFTPNPLAIQKFLMLFPMLASADWSECVLSDHQLLELHAVSCPLQVLNLHKCSGISAAAVASVALKFSSTLEELQCMVLDDCAVIKLASCCRQIRRIRWNCDGILITGNILTFCANNPLEMIDFTCSLAGSSLITNELIERIARRCGLLQSITLVDCNVDYSLLPILTGNCKRLATVSMCSIDLAIRHDPVRGRCCDVKWKTDSTDDAAVVSFLSHIALPIATFGNMVRFIWVGKEALRMLVAGHANSLQTVWLEFDDCIERSDVQHLVTTCTNLTALLLSAAGKECLFDDADIRRLPKLLPKLVEMELDSCAPSASDAALIDMLTGYKNNAMRVLDFTGCRLLTDAVLTKMSELFPGLQTVSLIGTAISNEALLAFILKQVSLKRLGLPYPDVLGWLQEQLRESGASVAVKFSNRSY